MTFKAIMSMTVRLNIEAESEDEAYEWLLCHTPKDALEISESVDVSYDEEIMDTTDEEPDITV